MKRSGGSLVGAALPVRGLLQRFGLLVLLALAATLLVADRTGIGAARDLRMIVADAAAPVLDALSRPVESANDLVSGVVALADLHAENAELRETVERLKRWEIAARQLEQENRALRSMARLAPEALPAYVTGRVVGESGSAFVRTLLANAGARDGVRAGQAAITGDGLVGRVVEVGRRASRVLLLTDLNSRIPVVLERTRQRAILSGDNSALARLAFLPRDATVAVGERVVTSGHGGVLPPGLPVGVVVRVSPEGASVRPIADLGRVDYVRLVAWTPPAFDARAGGGGALRSVVAP